MRSTPPSPALVALALLLAAPAARADADDIFSITPAVGWMHDNNLFRLSSGALADDVGTASLTLKLDKTYSLQRFEVQASYVDIRYKNYSYLNYGATPYSAAWRWGATPYLHGNLTTSSTTSLAGFDQNYNYTKKNINTTKNSRFDGTLDVSPSWHLLAGISQRDYSNSLFTQGEGNNRVNSADFGLSYTPSSGSTISVVSRSGRGEYYNRPTPIAAPIYFDTEFDERENGLNLHWLPTGKTSVDAKLAYLERTHDHFASRNFGGTIGNVNVNWNYSGTALLTGFIAREIASYQTVNANYTQTDRIGVMPSWQLDGKTTLRLRYDYAWRDYLGTPGVLAPSGRRDELQTGRVELEWHPVRTTTVSASLQTESRNSNQSFYDYNDNLFNISAQMTF